MIKMAIDYRKEVDSGYDRKRLVESSIIALLRDGIPIDIITQSKEFNFKHHEMARNLEFGHNRKVEEYTELFGLYGIDESEVILPERFDGVAHPVGDELYPMTEEEEIEKFKLRDSIKKEIAKVKKAETKACEKQLNKAANALTKFKAKNPIIDNIIEVIEEMDRIEDRTSNDLIELFKRHGLDPKNHAKYNQIYSEYQRLLREFQEASLRYEKACNGIINTSELFHLMERLTVLETEIVQRNIKLVNGFIRQKYSSLLVETEELFQTCYIAMWEASEVFDYRKGNRFSTLAYAYMDTAVKHNFKALTGYSWENYWGKRKIQVLLKNAEEMLGTKATIDDLVDFGLLDISETSANNLLNMASSFSISELYDLNEQSYEDWEIDSQYTQSLGEDEVLDYESLPVEAVDDLLDQVMNTAASDDIKRALDTLPERERIVIINRFGLDGEREKNLAEIGELFGVGRERIRQIEAKALRHLRYPSRANMIRSHY